jgi:aerobic-type carbon monoxide dehydrogenase small subunit (CoxS/CutS family)
MIALRVNGQTHHLEVDPQTPLLWVLRDHLGLMGTKYSCGVGECGACTVHLDGRAVLSCLVTLEEASAGEVTTIEGLSGPVGQAVKRAWIAEDVPQCGYCQPGQIMTAAALLASHPSPSQGQVEAAMSSVLCRCGTYQAARQAIARAREEINHD